MPSAACSDHEIELFADLRGDRLLGSGGIERHLAAGKSLRIDAAERHVGVGDGRLAAAAAVAHWARLGAGACRADHDAAEPVDAGDGTAAGADLDHLDDRNAQRQARALGETVDACHLEQPRGLRLRLVDEADFRRGAAHVERYDLVEAVLTRDAGGEDRAAGRPGFDEPHRKADGGLGGGDAAARGHQQHRAAEAGTRQFALELADVTAHQRLQVGVGAGRRETLVFAHFRRDVRRQRHGEIRQPPRDRRADPALVLRIGEAVQKPDRHGLDLLRNKCLNRAGNAVVVERHQHRALGIDAFAHRQPQPARHQRRRQVDIEIVLLEAVFVADLDHVAKAFGGQQRGLGALALDQRIGGERGAVDDQAHIGRRDAGRGDHRMHDREHAVFRRARRGQSLRGVALVADFERDIGEGAADIDTEPDVLHVTPRDCRSGRGFAFACRCAAAA